MLTVCRMAHHSTDHCSPLRRLTPIPQRRVFWYTFISLYSFSVYKQLSGRLVNAHDVNLLRQWNVLLVIAGWLPLLAVNNMYTLSAVFVVVVTFIFRVADVACSPATDSQRTASYPLLSPFIIIIIIISSSSSSSMFLFKTSKMMESTTGLIEDKSTYGKPM